MATIENAHALEETENISQVEYDSLKKVFQWMDIKKDNKLDAQEISDVLLTVTVYNFTSMKSYGKIQNYILLFCLV